MIDAFDSRDGHILFAMPFIDAISSKHGSVAAMNWVFDVISPFAESHEPSLLALNLAKTSLTKNDITALATLGRNADTFWRVDFERDYLLCRSVARFLWASMGVICFHCDKHYVGGYFPIEFHGKVENQLRSSLTQAASAVNLAFKQELAQSRTLQHNLALDFSETMERLGSNAV